MLIILSEHASIYREEPMKKRTAEGAMKGLYSQCMLACMLARMPVRGSARRPARRLAFRSFEGEARDQSRVQPFTTLDMFASPAILSSTQHFITRI